MVAYTNSLTRTQSTDPEDAVKYCICVPCRRLKAFMAVNVGNCSVSALPKLANHMKLETYAIISGVLTDGCSSSCDVRVSWGVPDSSRAATSRALDTVSGEIRLVGRVDALPVTYYELLTNLPAYSGTD